MCTGKLLAASAVVFALTGMPNNGGAVGANLHEEAGHSNHVLLLKVHGCHRDWQDGWIPQWRVKLNHRHGGDCQPKAGGKGKYFKNRGWQPWSMPERRYDEDGYDHKGDGRYDRPDEGGYDEDGYDRRGDGWYGRDGYDRPDEDVRQGYDRRYEGDRDGYDRPDEDGYDSEDQVYDRNY